MLDSKPIQQLPEEVQKVIEKTSDYICDITSHAINLHPNDFRDELVNIATATHQSGIEQGRVFSDDELKIIKQDLDGLLKIAQMHRKVVVSAEPDEKMLAWINEDIRQDEIRKTILKKIEALSTSNKEEV